MAKTFVGIGFGPIQSGLFLLEAHASGNFGRLVVAEVQPELVTGVRAAGGNCVVNVAHRNEVIQESLPGVEIFYPLEERDREQLVAAVAEASEIATALPSTAFYDREQLSPAEILARGIWRKLADKRLPPAIVYAAENQVAAAAQLRALVAAKLAPAEAAQLDERVQFVDTVIGKMSGVVTSAAQMRTDGLAPLYAGSSQAVLVEAFNRIFIDQMRLAGFERGICVFEERPHLEPFEEAKLYGHNATHALLGYLANLHGTQFMYEADNELLTLVRRAFVEESGAALCQRHRGVDPMFTDLGWLGYVDDLLERMTNRFLRDRVDRIIRDPRRKLGWNDRLVGTMRLALAEGIEPARYALGAAAAVELLLLEEGQGDLECCLSACWPAESTTASERAEIIKKVRHAAEQLRTRGPLT